MRKERASDAQKANSQEIRTRVSCGIFIFHKNKTEMGGEVVGMEKVVSTSRTFYITVHKTPHIDQILRTQALLLKKFSHEVLNS